jgi:hypothetical protein
MIDPDRRTQAIDNFGKRFDTAPVGRNVIKHD